MLKKTLLIIVSLVAATPWLQAQKLNYSFLNKSAQQTDLLISDSKPFTVLAEAERTHYNAFNFLEAYQGLAQSDSLNRFENKTLLKSIVQQTTSEATVFMGFVHTEYEFIKPEAYENGWVEVQNNSLHATGNHPLFTKVEKTIIAPLVKRKVGLKTTFQFHPQFFINTTTKNIQKIAVDFDDGHGFRNFSPISQQTIHYETDGLKNIKFNVQFTNGEVKEIQTPLRLDYSNEDLRNIYGWAIETTTASYAPDLSIYGENDNAPGVLEYEIFLSDDQILDKPIFVVDGFDPGDTRGIQAVYNMLSYTDENNQVQNLADYVRQEEGFDVVVVNFPTYSNENGNTIDGGADYIERNALALVTLIEEINNQKVGEEQNVLIGPSMGGLITRYALKYMEDNDLDHDSRLWISVDSPHNGANVAMSVQYLVDYLGYGYPDIDEIKVVMEGMLRSKAAMQMLVDHIDAHGSNQPLTPSGAPIYFDAFQDRMALLGYPEETRNIAITNGSGYGILASDLYGNPVYPSYDIADGEIYAGQVLGLNTRLKLNAKFMPYANQTSKILSAKAQAQIVTWVSVDNYEAYGAQNADSDGVDAAPGGLFDLLGLLDDFQVDPAYADLLQNALDIINVGAFNFIPTTSALALYNQPDYYHIPNLGEGDRPWDNVVETHPETPFVNWFLAEVNEGHVKLTPENINFVLCELIEPTYELKAISTENILICESQTFNSKVYFEIKKGCFAEAVLTIENLPENATASMNYDTLTENTLVTIHCENFPVGVSSFSVVPDNKLEEAVTFTVTVQENVGDMTGMTGFSVDNGINFTHGESGIVAPNSTVLLQMNSEEFNGTATWFDPDNLNRGASPIVENIQYESIENGLWRVDLLFNSSCNILGAPTTVFFNLEVGDPLSVEEEQFNNLVLYPNPSADIVTIQSLDNQPIGSITLLDELGRLVYSDRSIQEAQHTIDLAWLSNGNYTLKIQHNKTVVYKKLIKI